MSDMESLAIDFYNGANVVEKLAVWAYVAANHQMVIEQVASFERAYEQLLDLHASGKLGAGAADLSAENLALVKRINRLIQAGLGSDEARLAAGEVQLLAEQCLRALREPAKNPE